MISTPMRRAVSRLPLAKLRRKCSRDQLCSTNANIRPRTDESGRRSAAIVARTSAPQVASSKPGRGVACRARITRTIPVGVSGRSSAKGSQIKFESRHVTSRHRALRFCNSNGTSLISRFPCGYAWVTVLRF